MYTERYVGFYAAFLIPTLFFLTTLPVLFFCKKHYRLAPPSGSVLGPAVKLLFRGTKGRWHLNPVATYRHMNDGTFWESVKVRRPGPIRLDLANVFLQPSHLGAAKPSWMTFDDAWVDEVARGWSACGVLLWLP